MWDFVEIFPLSFFTGIQKLSFLDCGWFEISLVWNISKFYQLSYSSGNNMTTHCHVNWNLCKAVKFFLLSPIIFEWEFLFKKKLLCHVIWSRKKITWWCLFLVAVLNNQFGKWKIPPPSFLLTLNIFKSWLF